MPSRDRFADAAAALPSVTVLPEDRLAVLRACANNVVLTRWRGTSGYLAHEHMFARDPDDSRLHCPHMRPHGVAVSTAAFHAVSGGSIPPGGMKGEDRRRMPPAGLEPARFGLKGRCSTS